MIETKPSFYYGIEINEGNSWFDFQEGAGPVISVQIALGNYTPSTITSALSKVMNASGTQAYSVTVNRSTRILTIAAASNFRIRQATGNHPTDGVWDELDFGGDTSLALTVSTISAVGDVWRPQFLPQDWVPFEHNISSVDGIRKESTSGAVEVVSFGKVQTMEMNITFITNNYVDGVFDNNPEAVSEALSFLNYAINGNNLDFMQDRDNPESFNLCILESTPESQDGLSFKLKELYGKGLPGFYETGLIKFRKV